MPRDGELAVTPVDAVPDEATVIPFSELSDAERSLLETAVEDGPVRACMSDEHGRADALQSFSNRVGEPSSYLRYRGQYYGLWVRITDVVSAGTADPPGTDADPCC